MGLVNGPHINRDRIEWWIEWRQQPLKAMDRNCTGEYAIAFRCNKKSTTMTEIIFVHALLMWHWWANSSYLIQEKKTGKWKKKISFEYSIFSRLRSQYGKMHSIRSSWNVFKENFISYPDKRSSDVGQIFCVFCEFYVSSDLKKSALFCVYSLAEVRKLSVDSVLSTPSIRNSFKPQDFAIST